MTTFFYHIKLIRPFNVIISGFAMVIAASILHKNQIEWGIVLLTSVIVMCYTAAANALNDAIDYKIDLINKPTRPIPMGYVQIKSAMVISYILFSTGALLCMQLSDTSKMIGIIIAIPLMVVYNISLKGKPLIGNIAVSLTLGLSFLFCGSAHGNVVPMWIPMILAFGLTLIRELVKDIADIEGDRSIGISTFPIIAGIDRAVHLTVFLALLVGLGSFIPYFNGIYGFYYGILLILGVEIPLGVVVFLLLNNPGITSATKGTRILKFSTLMGLIAIYAGTIK